MAEARVIKKYPNRRLYDTEISSYITLDDVRELVLEHQEFMVVDAKTKIDITRSILLQIILEQEEDGEPIFTEQALAQIIRFYGDSMQGMVSDYLTKSLDMFVGQQERVREQVQSVMSGDPLGIMRDVTEQNLSMWKDMQDNFLKAAMPGASNPRPSSKRSSNGAKKTK